MFRLMGRIMSLVVRRGGFKFGPFFLFLALDSGKSHTHRERTDCTGVKWEKSVYLHLYHGTAFSRESYQVVQGR